MLPLHRLSRGCIALVSLRWFLRQRSVLQWRAFSIVPRRRRYQEIVYLPHLFGIWRSLLKKIVTSWVMWGENCALFSRCGWFLCVSSIFIDWKITCSDFLFAKSSNVLKHWIILSLEALLLFRIALFCVCVPRRIGRVLLLPRRWFYGLANV